ncbi:MAG: hypothetical protein U1E27_11970 [Kiritimatiellia bacterium]|nr:hypothetical protein [Kiritimatiellia bacterium]
MIWNLNQRAKAVQKQEVLGLDLGASSIKAVRLKRQKDEIHLVSTGVFPPIDLSGKSVAVFPRLPESLSANYAAVCVSHEKSALRILTLAGTDDLEAQIREQLGAGADTRFAHLPLTPPNVKPARVLAASLPQDCVDACLALFRSGPPAACSLELSGLSVLSACLYSLGEESAQGPICVMEAGAQSTYVFFLHRGAPVLVRKYDIGAIRLLEAIEAELEVDRETALGLVQEGAIDLSHIFRDVMESAVRQIVISRDFVERQEKCRIGKILCSGAMTSSPFWRQMLRDTSAMEVEPWNPFSRLIVAADAMPTTQPGWESRFACALGAALGVMESP